MDRVRTALVGCGKVGQTHAQALASLPESQFVAVCDSDLARARSFASRFAAHPFGDVAEMLGQCRPEVVCIATPHPLHASAAIAAARAGTHALVEKPLAASLADCDAMLAAAQEYHTKLGVISQRRWYEPVKRMKHAIDAAKIGRPVLGAFIMYSWRDPAYYLSDPWRGRWDTEGGGVLVNQSPHMLDLLTWLMNDEVAEVSGYWANLNHPTVEVEDTAVAILRFRQGGLGSIVSSLAQKPGIYTKVHIHGSSGASVGVETDRGATFIAGVSTIVEPPLNDLWTVPGEEAELPRFQAEDRAQFETIDPTYHYHSLQIHDFLRAVIDDRPPLVTGTDGRRVVSLFEAIYQSNRQRRSVTLATN
jgi:UDP-N-acetyl-2-amino-2-deoxyglucuronate dehydrogenase